MLLVSILMNASTECDSVPAAVVPRKCKQDDQKFETILVCILGSRLAKKKNPFFQEFFQNQLVKAHLFILGASSSAVAYGLLKAPTERENSESGSHCVSGKDEQDSVGSSIWAVDGKI